MTPKQAQIIRCMALDHADWNGKMWELHNHGYTPAEVRDALDALERLAGNEVEESSLDNYTPQ